MILSNLRQKAKTIELKSTSSSLHFFPDMYNFTYIYCWDIYLMYFLWLAYLEIFGQYMGMDFTLYCFNNSWQQVTFLSSVSTVTDSKIKIMNMWSIAHFPLKKYMDISQLTKIDMFRNSNKYSDKQVTQELVIP